MFDETITQMTNQRQCNREDPHYVKHILTNNGKKKKELTNIETRQRGRKSRRWQKKGEMTEGRTYIEHGHVVA